MQLFAKFATENITKCLLSLDAGCFDDVECEFRQVGKKLFEPSMMLMLKFILMPIVPKYVNKFISVP